jgi:hypothetical protein
LPLAISGPDFELLLCKGFRGRDSAPDNKFPIGNTPERGMIAAESPQDLHWLVVILLSQNCCSPMHPGQIRGLGAESPVFCPVAGKKCAIFDWKK